MSVGTLLPVPVDDAVLTRAIDEWLGGRRESVVRLCRRPWEYSTSAPLELVTASTTDGREHHLVLKHLGPGHVPEHVRRAKPSFVVDSAREIEVYRQLLAPLGIGPSLVASRMAPDAGVYWLLLEHVEGPRLAEVGDVEAWVATAQWLGAFHARCNDAAGARRSMRLIECDREWYRTWIDRALLFFASDDPPGSRHSRNALRWLDGRYETVIDHLLSLPSVLMHGEFYPLNVIVAGGSASAATCPIDWEMASVGPGVLDLAALITGEWSEQERRSLIAAYLAGSGRRLTLDELSESVRFANIQRAVQWLGWFGRRRAVDAQARDWLGDAIEAAESLNL